MSVHVAIVTHPYDRLILDGRKKIECRLTRTPVPPFGCIAPGERIYFKRSAGPFFATAVADRIWATDNLTPTEVDRIRRQFRDRIRGAAEYWRSRRHCRYGTLIWLRQVTPTSMHPRYKPQNMRAWYALDESADPLRRAGRERSGRGRDSFEVELTAGALRQRSVRVRGHLDRFPPDAIGGRTRSEQGEAVALRLKGGPVVLSDIVGPQKMLRWRGWGPWFQQHGVRAGDRLRFVPDGEWTFLVEPVRRR